MVLLDVMILLTGKGVIAEESILIKVPEKVSVIGPQFNFGDIADVSGKNKAVLEKIRRIRIANAAQSGMVLKVSQGLLKITLRREGYSLKGIHFEGPETIQVLTQSQEFSTEEILPKVKAFAVQGSGESPENIEVKLSGAEKKILLPAGAVDVNFRAPLSGKYEGLLLLTTELMVNGRLARVMPLRVMVEVFRPVVVTTKRVEKGEKFTPENVSVVRKPSSKVLPGCLQRLENAVGRTAAAPVVPGTLLRLSALYDPPVVKRGELLQAVVQKGNVEITVGVRAIEEGKAGDSIRVENTQTHKVLRGRVLNEKMVSIEEGKP